MRFSTSLALLAASLLIATASSFAADSAPKATPFDQAQALMESLRAKALPTPASDSPYAQGAPCVQRIAGQLPQALEALAQSQVLCAGLGAQFVEHYRVIKQLEQDRYDAASDKLEFSRREYFGRI